MLKDYRDLYVIITIGLEMVEEQCIRIVSFSSPLFSKGIHGETSRQKS